MGLSEGRKGQGEGGRAKVEGARAKGEGERGEGVESEKMAGNLKLLGVKKGGGKFESRMRVLV